MTTASIVDEETISDRRSRSISELKPFVAASPGGTKDEENSIVISSEEWPGLIWCFQLVANGKKRYRYCWKNNITTAILALRSPCGEELIDPVHYRFTVFCYLSFLDGGLITLVYVVTLVRVECREWSFLLKGN